MKKSTIILLVAIAVLSLGLFASCATEELQEEAQQDYSYTGETDIEIDDRSFVLEDPPESKAEEAVVMDFLYTITGEFDKKPEVIADIEPLRMSIEAEKNHLEEGVYIKSYVIHNIATLSEEQYANDDSSEKNNDPLYYVNLQNLLDEYDLVDYKIVNVDYTMMYSEKALEWGPQYPEGTYSRSYLVGKEFSSDNYKIYDYGSMWDAL